MNTNGGDTQAHGRLPNPSPAQDPDRSYQAATHLSSPRFHAFLAAQFLGAANDNAFKITLILYLLSVITGEARQAEYASLTAALYPVPFLLFSPLAGYCSDRFAKHRVLLLSKLPEVAVMALAAAGFALGSVPFLFGVLFLAATHSAFFSPAKYGLLPEIFDDSRLSIANGVLELTTDIAILFGSVAGVYIYSLFRDDLVKAAMVFVATACLGVLAVAFVPRAPAGNRDARFVWNLLASFRGDLEQVRRIPALFYTVIGIAWFGLLGSFFLTIIPVFGRSVLGLREERAGMLLAMLSMGVGVGSLLAGRLSRKHLEIGLVPLGSIGISVFALMLSGSGHGRMLPIALVPAGTAADLTMLGLAAGLFIIPLNAMLQQRAPAGMKGRLIAFSNVLTFAAVLIGALLPWLFTRVLGMGSRQAILIVAMLTLAGTAYVVAMLPDFLVRLVLWLMTNTIYRIRAAGEENVPKEGALLVVNHVSWVDAIMVMAACDRMVRFLMFRPYYEWKGLNWFFRMMHAIPVAASDSPELIAQSLEIAGREIGRGHVVCIFAEGSISRTGNLLKFRRGLERIASGVRCPIVPVYLDGVWGSIFSFDRGRFLFKRPRRILEPVTVFFGPPLPSSARSDRVRQAIQELSAEAFRSHRPAQRPIHIAFIRRAKKRWRSVLASDSQGATISFGNALVRAIAISRSLWRSAPLSEERVGILMPPGIDALIANLAVYIGGRVPVNLDSGQPGDIAPFMVQSAGIREVLSSRGFVRAPALAGRLADVRLRFIDDAEHSWSGWRRAALHAACRVLPGFLIARFFVRGELRSVDHVATILYSSPPAEPEHPRGAMLTHHNLLSNLESLRQVFRVTRDDCILGLLPFSNSLGFSATLLLPMLTGARVVYPAQAADSAGLGPICRDARVTLIPATPALLSTIMENVAAQALGELRHVAVGGGDLDERLRDRFAAKFGVEPLEGYGCPECAPIISLNVPDYVQGRQRQYGSRRGSAGHPLPGVCVRIADPQSGEPLPQGKQGVLMVRGPNVMQGYIDGAEATGRVLRDGWYVTGELASLDSDGFIHMAARTAPPPTAS